MDSQLIPAIFKKIRELDSKFNDKVSNLVVTNDEIRSIVEEKIDNVILSSEVLRILNSINDNIINLTKVIDKKETIVYNNSPIQEIKPVVKPTIKATSDSFQDKQYIPDVDFQDNKSFIRTPKTTKSNDDTSSVINALNKLK